MELMKILAASSAIIFPLILLVGLNFPAKQGMFYSLIIVALFSIFIWEMDLLTIISAMTAGAIKSLTIVYILAGAMFLLNILRNSGLLDTMVKGFQVLTGDRRIQLIIVGFYFVALLEGAAGFGAPAAIVGPLLVLLGFSPYASVVLSLIANAVPMTYGAVGTPLVDGIGTPLQIILKDSGQVIDGVNQVSVSAAFVDLFLGSFMPVLLVLLYTTLFSKESDQTRRYRWEIVPFAFVSGLIYTTLAYFSAVYIGPEFGTLIGSLVGLVLVILLIRFRIFLPKEEASHHQEKLSAKELLKAWFPYVLVIGFLILTRTIPWLKQLLNIGTITWKGIFGTDISASFDVLYSPGFILLMVAVIIIGLFRINSEAIHSAAEDTGRTVVKTILALAPSLAMVYIFLNSNINTAGLAAMPDYLANKLVTVYGRKWVFVAPFLGNLGTFIAGSTTTSNIMFTGIQYRMATINSIPPLIYLTAQVLGANTGCMISVSKVVSACSVVGLTGSEGKVMRITMVVALIYSLIIGIYVFLLV